MSSKSQNICLKIFLNPALFIFFIVPLLTYSQEPPEPSQQPSAHTEEQGQKEKNASKESDKVDLEEEISQQSPQKWGFQGKVGEYIPSNYKGPGPSSFNGLYPSTEGVWGEFGLEYQVYQGYGKLGVKGTSGYYQVIQETPRFAVIPIYLSALYRAHFWDKQIIVPYGELGGGVNIYRQGRVNRVPGVNPGRYTERRPVFIMSAGGQLNLNVLDPSAARAFDINWGINTTYLVVEVRRIISHNQKNEGNFDFTGNYVMGGLLFEF